MRARCLCRGRASENDYTTPHRAEMQARLLRTPTLPLPAPRPNDPNHTHTKFIPTIPLPIPRNWGRAMGWVKAYFFPASILNFTDGAMTCVDTCTFIIVDVAFQPKTCAYTIAASCVQPVLG